MLNRYTSYISTSHTFPNPTARTNLHSKPLKSTKLHPHPSNRITSLPQTHPPSLTITFFSTKLRKHPVDAISLNPLSRITHNDTIRHHITWRHDRTTSEKIPCPSKVVFSLKHRRKAFRCLSLLRIFNNIQQIPILATSCPNARQTVHTEETFVSLLLHPVAVCFLHLFHPCRCNGKQTANNNFCYCLATKTLGSNQQLFWETRINSEKLSWMVASREISHISLSLDIIIWSRAIDREVNVYARRELAGCNLVVAREVWPDEIRCIVDCSRSWPGELIHARHRRTISAARASSPPTTSLPLYLAPIQCDFRNPAP